MKERNGLKRFISMLLLLFQLRICGCISNIVNFKGVESYNELIENFVDFLYDKNITDPQNIYECFNYAVWNGYFSKNRELNYSFDRKIFIDNPGMSIASGDAVCLNFADMLSCIFREFGYNSYMAVCYVDSSNVTIERIRTDVKRNINNEATENDDLFFDNIIMNNVSKIFGNHAITCVEHNGEVYIFDPTNLIYLEKVGFNDLNFINGCGKFDLRYFTSILYENTNIFKLMSSINDNNYKIDVTNKPELKFDIESLEKFHYDNRKLIGEINKVNKRGTTNGIIEMIIYSFFAYLILNGYKKLIKKVAFICKEKDIQDIRNISKELKEYFNEYDIKGEFEILKNYELINKELGIKNNLVKDLLRKSVLILNNLINDDIFYNNILVVLLSELGYKSNVCYVKKYKSKLLLGNRVLINYEKDNKYYYYDPEIGELLYEDDKKILYSKDNKYRYKTYTDYKLDSIKNIEDLVNYMNKENSLLTKSDIKELKKNKTLRVK